MTLDPQDRIILDAKLNAAFVPHLPALQKSQGAVKDAEENLSRSFGGLAVSALCGASNQIGAQSVTDDCDDYGLDAIFYNKAEQTMFFVQAKLKESAQFTQAEANAFAQGVRKIINLDFVGMNPQILARQDELTTSANARINGAKMQTVFSKPVDDLRQALWDVVQPMTTCKGPLAIMRNQTDVPDVLDKVMTAHFGLTADETLPKKRAQATTPVGVKNLFRYLAEKAPQIGGLS